MKFEFDTVRVDKRYKVRRFYLDGELIGKSCSSCEEDLPRSAYSKNNNVSDGLRSKCTTCRVERNREYYESNPHVYREWYAKTGLKNSRTTKARYRSRTLEQVLDDRNRLCPNGTKKCRRCGEDRLFSDFSRCISSSTGLQDNCMRCNNEKRDIKKKNSPENHWKSRNIPLSCYICGGIYEEYEHVVAKANRGTDELGNILPVCIKCNRGVNGKFDTPLLRWLKEYRSYAVYEVLTRVLSYGVSPWTYLDTPEEISTILTELEQYRASVL